MLDHTDIRPQRRRRRGEKEGEEGGGRKAGEEQRGRALALASEQHKHQPEVEREQWNHYSGVKVFPRPSCKFESDHIKELRLQETTV